MGQDMFAWEEEQHYYRHKVEVHLALSAVNALESSKTRFALKKEPPSLPFKVLQKGGSSFQTAKKIFKELAGTDADPWLVIKQVGVLDQVKDDTIIILYSVLMPELVPLLDSTVEWVDFEKLSQSPTLLNMVGQACNYYKGV